MRAGKNCSRGGHRPGFFYPDVTGNGVLKREFNLVGEDNGHRALLQHLDRSALGETVGCQLLALQRINFVAKSDQAND